MESVRIIELQNNDSILALYNPDDMAEHGLTSSFMTQQISNNMNMPALMQFIVNFTREHLTAEMNNDYSNYLPVSLSILSLPNDRVLPAMLLMKEESDFMTQYIQMHQNGPQPVDEEAREYITEYVNEFLNEKESDAYTPANAENNKPKNKQHKNIDQYLFKFDNLKTAISACRFIPFKKCIDHNLIKYDNKYYILFSCDSKESDSIYISITRFLEFGCKESSITPDFLKEHGTLITSQLEKIIQAGLV